MADMIFTFMPHGTKCSCTPCRALRGHLNSEESPALNAARNLLVQWMDAPYPEIPTMQLLRERTLAFLRGEGG